MKAIHLKRILSFVLVCTMVLGLCPALVFAGDTLPPMGESAYGENEPSSHGYRTEDLLNWDPATDPYSDILRARVPLQNRIDVVRATQANPDLTPEVLYLTLAGDYGNAFFGTNSYSNEFSDYLFNFWQYTDIYASWHGQTTANTPFELWDSEGERNGTSNWQNRAFEFGMLNLPNAAYTNAAHRNGALSIGCIFLPRAYQTWKTLVLQDENGNYPYADKLYELTEYYGFDGWFVNLEGNERPSSAADHKELQGFLKALREKGLYVNWYDASDYVNESYMDSGAIDSDFLNYNWNTNHIKTATEKYGYDAVFAGFEAGDRKWTRNDFSRMWSDGKVASSICSLGADFVHHALDEDFGNYLETRRENNEFQWMSQVRERMWFTGSSGNPTDPSVHTNAEVGVPSNKVPGMASLVSERSVIGGDTFHTNFNTGHGLCYAVDGEISNTHEWANINLQDILPTWQFWFESEGTALQAEYDYGTGYKKGLKWSKDGNYTYGEFDFDLVDPYQGGSSLAVYGAMDSDNFMRLYKTDLEVTADTKIDVTFRKTSTDNVEMGLGLVFASSINSDDNTYAVTDIALENTVEASDGWVTATVDLSEYAGEHIAVIGLNFTGSSENYQMHVGEINYTSGRDLTPAAPTGLDVSRAFDTHEMIVTWDMADYDTVKLYNVYAVIDGKEQYMGGIYDGIFYIKSLYGADGEITIKVTAVGEDGTESEAAVTTYDYNKAVTDLVVETADGTVTASWTPADPKVATEVSVHVPLLGETYTTTVAAGETTAVVNVPTGETADGKVFTLTVTPEGGESKDYDGQLDDSFCLPYDAPMTNHKLTSPIACNDWHVLNLSYTTESGASKTDSYTRGHNTHGELNNDWSRFQDLPRDIATLTVTLTDYAGNVSVPTSYVFVDGEPVDLTGPIDDYVPDPVLRVMIEMQIGNTLKDMLNYQGSLDLSDLLIMDYTGLEMIAGLTSLNLSENHMEKITPDMFPAGLKELDLTGCQELTSVNLKGAPDVAVKLDGCTALTSLDLTGTKMTELDLSTCTALETVIVENSELKSIDLSGCAKLQNLYLANTKLASLDITGLNKLHNLDISNCAIVELKADNASAYTNAYRWNWNNNLLDLSDNTNEGALKNGINSYFETADIPLEYDRAEVQLGRVSISSWGSGYATVDLGSANLLTKIVVNSDYAYYYGYFNGNVEISSDNEEWTLAEAISGNDKDSYTVTLPEGTMARYVRVPNGTAYGSVNVYGHATAEKGFTYGGQKPAVIRDDVKAAEFAGDGAAHQLLDLLAESYASARTLNGTYLTTLVESDWIDASYCKTQITAPKGVKVAITDSQGNAYVADPQAPSLGELDTDNNVALNAHVIGASGTSSSSEIPEKLFDGVPATKWCTSGQSCWMGFYLDEPAIVGQWFTLNAGSEGAQYITVACRLQVLNPEGDITEEEYLEMTNAQQKSILGDSSKWVDIGSYADNYDNEVTVEVDADALKEARVYRFYVDKSIPGSSYAAVRIYELELYSYTGQLGANTNGILVADTLDTYDVSYVKSKEEIASTTVTVRVPTVEEVIAAIDAIGAPITLESKDVLKAARAAYENLPEDQKALVTNYSDLLAGEKAYADFFRGEYSDVLQARYEELTEDRYSNKGQAKLDAALADGLNRIAQAPNMQALDAALEEALANLNAVPNYQKEMELALEEANKAVLAASKYYAYVELMQIDLSDFNACQMAKAETVLAAARAAVDAAETVEAVDGAVAAAKEAVAEIAAQRCAAEEFSDVSLNDWFHEDADFMLNNGYMNGYPGGTFRPDVKVSRAQLVTILYRVAGEPEVEGAADFSDVAEDYYTNAVIWAAEQGITTGYPDGTFRPNAEVSRQELVTFLYRFAEAEAVEEDHLTQFPDAGKVADYAVESMNWAIANGIVSGAVRDNVLVIAPEDTARRDETCAIVARYMNAN